MTSNTDIKLIITCPLTYTDTRLSMEGGCRICVAQLSALCAKCSTLRQIKAGEIPTFPKQVTLISKKEFDKLVRNHTISLHIGRRRYSNSKSLFKPRSKKSKYSFKSMKIGSTWTGLVVDAGKIRSALNSLKTPPLKSFTTKTEGTAFTVRRIA